MNIEYLIDKYSKLVYKICYDMLNSPLDAQDTSQEVFLSFYLNIKRYINIEENEIKNIICKIALNKCRDILKSKARKLENLIVDNQIELENYSDNNDIDENIYIKQRSIFIKKMINEIREPYSKVLYDYYIDELSLDEISKKHKITKATLKMQLHRGRKILKDKISEFGGENLL